MPGTHNQLSGLAKGLFEVKENSQIFHLIDTSQSESEPNNKVSENE